MLLEESRENDPLSKNKYQIFDVDLARKDMKDMGVLLKMNKKRNELKMIEAKIRNSSDKEKYVTKQMKVEKKFHELKQIYQRLSGMQEDYNPNKKSILYAFVTFRSMQGAAIVMDKYEEY